MLSKKQRYPLRQDRRFFQTARRTQNTFFVVFLKDTDAKLSAQAAVIVPKKVFPKAVQRNKAKRWIQAALSPTLSQLRGTAVVVLVRRPLRFQDVEKIRELLRI